MKNNLRFPKEKRLVTKFEFSNLFDGSKKVSQKHLLALYKPNILEQARLGVVVGKRVANHAVTRNQIKRVIRESFRANQQLLPNLDIVVIARQQCDSLDKIQLRKGIDNLWQSLLIQYQKSLR